MKPNFSRNGGDYFLLSLQKAKEKKKKEKKEKKGKKKSKKEPETTTTEANTPDTLLMDSDAAPVDVSQITIHLYIQSGGIATVYINSNSELSLTTENGFKRCFDSY